MILRGGAKIWILYSSSIHSIQKSVMTSSTSSPVNDVIDIFTSEDMENMKNR